MNFNSILRRLRGVEQTKGADEVTLVFADDSTRAIRIRRNNQLELCLDAFRKMRAYPPPAPEGVPTTPPPPEPKTANDRALDILGRAERIESAPRFLQFIHGLARQIHERRNAPALHQEK
jgi:hypothetical protein